MVSQILIPMLTQLINTFVHLFALNLYNCEERGLRGRVCEVGKCYFKALAVRVVGFTAVYGIGGVVNL